MQVELMTIGQLSRETGVTPRAVRNYEHLGLVRAPIRTNANYRIFDRDSVARVRFSSGLSSPNVASSTSFRMLLSR